MAKHRIKLPISFRMTLASIDAVRDCGRQRRWHPADDTLALQQGIDASCGVVNRARGKTKILFIPNGTYRVTKTLLRSLFSGPLDLR
jgi:hypothetical protein